MRYIIICADKTTRTVSEQEGQQAMVSWASIMTGAVLLTAPMILVFVFLQRFFMSGITAGAVK